MHLYFFVRGKFEQVEQWKCHAQAAYWKFRRINQDTQKEEIILVQGALRPSVMGAYEYVFPKEALPEVCSFFGIKDNTSYKHLGLFSNMRHFCLRKVFGAKKIPTKILKAAQNIPDTFSTSEFERGVTNCKIPGVAFHAIGIKDDAHYVIGNYFQEAL